jgi:hypothetical protein
MGRHECRPPEGRQPFDISPWICPECGDVWVADPPGPIDPAPSFDFATQQGITPAVWVREGEEDY